MVFLDVVLCIIKINRILSEYFNEDANVLFKDGYCLDYYEILKSLYTDAIMVIEKDKYHCAALINDEVYDVTGIRNKDEFYVASSIDEDFVYSFYNRIDVESFKKVVKLVRGVSKKIK